MSCQTCNKVKAPVSMGHSGLNYVLDREAEPIIDLFGKKVDLSQPVAKRPHSPIGGWGVDFFINSIQTRFDGGGPDIVYHNVARAFELNNIEHTSTDLWLNLNIQWLQKVPKKYRRISMSQIMSVAMPVEYGLTTDPHAKTKPLGKSIQLSMWSLLEVYLCSAPERFSYNRFIVLAEVVKDLYSPEKSPFSGTSSDFQKITLSIENLSAIPRYTVASAREWLWETMVDLNLFVGTFQNYAAKNLWT